jgi:hypothetical protein
VSPSDTIPRTLQSVISEHIAIVHRQILDLVQIALKREDASFSRINDDHVGILLHIHARPVFCPATPGPYVRTSVQQFGRVPNFFFV